MSEIIKTKGIVLRKIDYGDSSKIATLLTEHHGKLSVILKGAKSAKSKIGGIVDLLNHVEIVLYKKAGRSVQVLTQADLITHYPLIKDDLDKIKYASAITELTHLLTIEEETHERMYRGLSRILDLMNNLNSIPKLLFVKYFLFFLEDIGYALEIEKCSQCSKNLKDSGVVKFNYDNGFMCSECGSNHLISHEFNEELFTSLYCLNGRQKNEIINESDLDSLIFFLEKYLSYHVDEFNGLRSLKAY